MNLSLTECYRANKITFQMKKCSCISSQKKENKESLSVTISLLPLRVPSGRKRFNSWKLEYSPAIQTPLWLHLYPHFLLTGHIDFQSKTRPFQRTLSVESTKLTTAFIHLWGLSFSLLYKSSLLLIDYLLAGHFHEAQPPTDLHRPGAQG